MRNCWQWAAATTNSTKNNCSKKPCDTTEHRTNGDSNKKEEPPADNRLVALLWISAQALLFQFSSPSSLSFAAFLGAAFSFFSAALASSLGVASASAGVGFAFLATGFSAFTAALAFGSATATASSSNGNTETNDLLLAFLRNTTLPSMRANRVWSLPMPTFTSGWCCVPRWRTMIFPAMARWPPNIFTPKRLLCDSRPFFELPAPFLCAMSYLLFMMGHRPVKQFGL